MRIASLVIVLVAFSTQVFAAHCPAANDFVQTEGDIWGHYWDLSSSAAHDWSINNKHFRTANSPVFPSEATLMATMEPQTGEVKCLYILPDQTGFMVTSNNDRKANLRKLDLSLFTPKHQSNTPPPIDKKHWQEDYSITSLTCTGTTAGNPEHCHWNWS